MKVKHCKKCNTTKSISEFNKTGPWRADRCKKCANKYSKEYARKRSKTKKEEGKWF